MEWNANLEVVRIINFPLRRMKILLDASSAIIGGRAVKRYTVSLIREFVSLNKGDEFKILLNYFRGNSEIIDLLIQQKSPWLSSLPWLACSH